MATIFISYNRQSKDITQVLVKDIESLGHTVWLDQELSGGQAWWDQILNKARNCDIFIFILDPKSLGSSACKLEYGYADKLGKPILPILVSDGVSMSLLPTALSKIQYIDYRTPDKDAGMSLARAINSIPPAGPLPDPMPDPPEVPLSYLGGLAEQVESPASLSKESQSAILIDLKNSLRNPETRDDAKVLLDKFSRRHDLLAMIAREIDELAGEKTKPSSNVYSKKEEAFEKKEPIPEKAKKPILKNPLAETEKTDNKPVIEKRLPTAVAGFVIGLFLGLIAMFTVGGDLYLLAFALITAFSGAVAGAIAGNNKILRIAAGIGFVAAWIIISLYFINEPEDSFAAGGVFGAPAGAILGVLIGLIYLKKKK